MKPRIAVPHWRAPTWERTKYYLDSIEAAGGENVIVDEDSLPQDVQGLMLLGGVDVDPALYGEKRGPKTERPHRERDAQELTLLRQAIERDIPVFCICRGHQLLNVAAGRRRVSPAGTRSRSTAAATSPTCTGRARCCA
jgi:gamma-glutamyl-gamma-aminobutyrate hydrolase PuuD